MTYDYTPEELEAWERLDKIPNLVRKYRAVRPGKWLVPGNYHPFTFGESSVAAGISVVVTGPYPLHHEVEATGIFERVVAA